ncbi:hypothetical protein GN956_G5479 [Arapaima gigas]
MLRAHFTVKRDPSPAGARLTPRPKERRNWVNKTRSQRREAKNIAFGSPQRWILHMQNSCSVPSEKTKIKSGSVGARAPSPASSLVLQPIIDQWWWARRLNLPHSRKVLHQTVCYTIPCCCGDAVKVQVAGNQQKDDRLTQQG